MLKIQRVHNLHRRLDLRVNQRWILTPRRPPHRNQQLSITTRRPILSPWEKLTKRQKAPAGDYLLTPVATDWLKSSSKLENVLGSPDNRVAQTLRKAQAQRKSLKSFIFAVNLQVPGKDQHSAVFYFATEKPIPSGSLLYRFINDDDSFRNQRFKIVNRIVKGPWIVEKTVGNNGFFTVLLFKKKKNYDSDVTVPLISCLLLIVDKRKALD